MIKSKIGANYPLLAPSLLIEHLLILFINTLKKPTTECRRIWYHGRATRDHQLVSTRDTQQTRKNPNLILVFQVVDEAVGFNI